MTFYPPHSQIKEMIGIARGILEAFLLNTKTKVITNEVLCTFMCEFAAMMNCRPICPILINPEGPSLLLHVTQKDFIAYLMRVDFHYFEDMCMLQWKHILETMGKRVLSKLTSAS